MNWERVNRENRQHRRAEPLATTAAPWQAGYQPRSADERRDARARLAYL